MNDLVKLLLKTLLEDGEDVVTDLIEEAGLEIADYDSFFDNLRALK